MLDRKLYEERSREKVPPILFDVGNVPKKFRDATVDAIPNECSYKKTIKDWVKNVKKNVDEGRWLLLWGTFGTGKTAAANILLREVLLHDGSAFMMTQSQLLDYRINGENGKFGSFTLDQVATQSNLVLLDDVGNTKSNDFTLESIEWLAVNRYNTGKSLIITTNLDPNGKKIKDFVTGKVLSMCYELSTIVELAGHNWRKV